MLLRPTTTGREQRLAPLHPQQTDVDRVEAVDIFIQADQPQRALLIDLRRQRELHQNAMHRRIVVQTADGIIDLLLRAGRIEQVGGGCKADLLAGAALHAHILRRCGIVPCQHRA
jgi:hypothetical protein